jgi:hypothetical protein
VTFIVLHHQLLTLGIKIIGAYRAGIELALQFSVATLSFLKVHLSTLQIYPHTLCVIDLNSRLVRKLPTFAHPRQTA